MIDLHYIFRTETHPPARSHPGSPPRKRMRPTIRGRQRATARTIQVGQNVSQTLGVMRLRPFLTARKPANKVVELGTHFRAERTVAAC